MANKVIKIAKKDVEKKIIDISEEIEAARTGVITPNDLRLSLMDYVDTNKPLYKEHLDDEKLWKCIEWAVGYYNDYPPELSKKYTIDNFPKKKLLLDLATVEALRLTSLIELRGEMQYSDGGIQSTVYYKSQHFSQLRQELKQSTDQEIQAVKRAQNINECYGALC